MPRPNLRAGATILLLVIAGCTSADVGACRGTPNNHLDQAGQLDYIAEWWLLDLAAATDGLDAGERLAEHGATRRLDSSGISAIRGNQADLPFLVGDRTFKVLRREGGQAIAGSRRIDGPGGESAHSVSIVALVDSVGNLRFVGNCATSFFTDSFASYVTSEHRGSSQSAVLIEHATSGDFSQYGSWLHERNR